VLQQIFEIKETVAVKIVFFFGVIREIQHWYFSMKWSVMLSTFNIYQMCNLLVLLSMFKDRLQLGKVPQHHAVSVR
jgi:hypothetical protein